MLWLINQAINRMKNQRWQSEKNLRYECFIIKGVSWSVLQACTRALWQQRRSCEQRWSYYILWILTDYFMYLSASALFLFSITCITSSAASFHHPWFLYVIARLIMLFSVEGCSVSSILSLAFITCTCSSSASFHCPWLLYVDARLIMLVSVKGCSVPSILFLVSITCTSSSSVMYSASSFDVRVYFLHPASASCFQNPLLTPSIHFLLSASTYCLLVNRVFFPLSYLQDGLM